MLFEKYSARINTLQKNIEPCTSTGHLMQVTDLDLQLSPQSKSRI